MKKDDTKAPFKFNILGFKLDTTITPLSFIQVMILIAIVMVFILVLIFFLREYALMGLVLHNTPKLEAFRIIKSKSP